MNLAAVLNRALGWFVLGLVMGGAVVGFVAWSALPAEPGDDSAEAGFARDMMTHHQQAVEMGLLIHSRTQDPAVKILATDIITIQQAENGQMQGWLNLWGLLPTGDEPPMAWMGHPTTGLMPGMATREEINQLANLSGAAADVAFLELMIRHHRGGIPMAEAIIGRTDIETVERFARSIVSAQTAEIATMESLLATKSAAPVEPGADHHEADGTPTASPTADAP